MQEGKQVKAGGDEIPQNVDRKVTNCMNVDLLHDLTLSLDSLYM